MRVCLGLGSYVQPGWERRWPKRGGQVGWCIKCARLGVKVVAAKVPLRFQLGFLVGVGLGS